MIIFFSSFLIFDSASLCEGKIILGNQCHFHAHKLAHIAREELYYTRSSSMLCTCNDVGTNLLDSVLPRSPARLEPPVLAQQIELLGAVAVAVIAATMMLRQTTPMMNECESKSTLLFRGEF